MCTITPSFLQMKVQQDGQTLHCELSCPLMSFIGVGVIKIGIQRMYQIFSYPTRPMEWKKFGAADCYYIWDRIYLCGCYYI